MDPPSKRPRFGGRGGRGGRGGWGGRHGGSRGRFGGRGGSHSRPKSYFKRSMTEDPWMGQVEVLCGKGELDRAQLNLNHAIGSLKIELETDQERGEEEEPRIEKEEDC